MDIWKHGKYLDLWSLAHFLSGFVLCGFFYWLGFTFWWAFAYSTLLLILWEIFEFFIKIIEPSWNVTTDILIGLGGFFLAAWLYYLRIQFDLYIYLTVVLATIALALWGFTDYLKKGYR